MLVVEKKCYSSKDLLLFKPLIIEKLKTAKEDLLVLEESKSNNTNDTFKPFDKDEREEEVELKLNAIVRQKNFIQSLSMALIRIENGNYGICHCSICKGKLIPEDRLRSVLDATTCRDAKPA
jgi:DnaK suppressor protein